MNQAIVTDFFLLAEDINVLFKIFQISAGDCNISDNVDSDDEPLISKKYVNRKGVKVCNIYEIRKRYII